MTSDEKLIAALRALHTSLPYSGDRQVLQLGIDRLVELTRPAERVDFANKQNFKGMVERDTTFDDHPLET